MPQCFLLSSLFSMGIKYSRASHLYLISHQVDRTGPPPTPTSPLHFCFYCNIETDFSPLSPLKRTLSFCGAGTYFSSCLRPAGHWSLSVKLRGSRGGATSYIMIKIPSVETAMALAVYIFLYVTSCQTVSQCAAAPVTHHWQLCHKTLLTSLRTAELTRINLFRPVLPFDPQHQAPGYQVLLHLPFPEGVFFFFFPFFFCKWNLLIKHIWHDNLTSDDWANDHLIFPHLLVDGQR